MNLYHDILMDHYRNPRHKGIIANPDFDSGEHNPSCGDTVSCTGSVRDGILVAGGFQAQGCVISQAAASLLFEHAMGKSVAEIMAYDAELMQQLVGTRLGLTRLRCATLSLSALHKGLALVRVDNA